ncbi:hypothetical protein ONS95_006346 [Cadophora gregata]|nr:uncharacterized protein ONS95_006346 [Cadophora gregata]KAK0099286.1 hypothetical protein ONS96_008518 [Cadophora gregata f. sp. sojae]KAK0102748.1 hypothetical protein ONS95_006346 [Cadophora gregata]
MNKLFSKASITRLEPLIESTIDGLITRLREFQDTNTVVTMSLAWGCVTMDIISDYAFGNSYNYVQTSKGFHSHVQAGLKGISKWGFIVKQVPWIMPWMSKLPHSVMRSLFPTVVDVLIFREDIQAQCEAAIHEQKGDNKSLSGRTIFHEILSSDLSPQEKTSNRLMQEGVALIGAGTETTAWILSVITYYVLANPLINDKLKDELNAMSKDCRGHPTSTQLEQLPYLGGVISEGLRLGFGVTAHLQRVSPDQDLIYGDWVIPAATPVSMSSLLLHLNPETFPEPHTFRPERWIENPRLSKYLVSFTKGSRQCLGINLAYAELYLCIFKVWMSFPDMHLVDTTLEDVEPVADYFIPVASGRGVKVLMG